MRVFKNAFEWDLRFGIHSVPARASLHRFRLTEADLRVDAAPSQLEADGCGHFGEYNFCITSVLAGTFLATLAKAGRMHLLL